MNTLPVAVKKNPEELTLKTQMEIDEHSGLWQMIYSMHTHWLAPSIF